MCLMKLIIIIPKKMVVAREMKINFDNGGIHLTMPEDNLTMTCGHLMMAEDFDDSDAPSYNVKHVMEIPDSLDWLSKSV